VKSWRNLSEKVQGSEVQGSELSAQRGCSIPDTSMDVIKIMICHISCGGHYNFRPFNIPFNPLRLCVFARDLFGSGLLGLWLRL